MTQRVRGEPPRPDDGRSRFSMAQFVRERLALNGRGWTRAELEALVRRQSRFRPQLQRNPKAYGAMIRRLIWRGEIEARGEALFATERTRLAVRVRCELFEIVQEHIGDAAKPKAGRQ